MKRLNLHRLAMACAALAVCCGAHATNIVSNSGFETGDFTGWTQFGNYTDDGYTGVDGNNTHGGDFAAFFGPVGPLGGIEQILNTTAGAEYVVKFWLFNGGGSPTEFVFNWDGGVAELDLVDSPAIGYTQFLYTLTASSSSTSLSFSFRQEPGYMDLDDVSVDDGVASVPEPASAALLGLGVAGLACVRRRKASLPARRPALPRAQIQ